MGLDPPQVPLSRRSFVAGAAALSIGAAVKPVNAAGGVKGRPDNNMAIAQGQATSRGAPIYFETIDLVKPWADKGETILFHHGLGASMEIWAEWLPQLIDSYRIIRLDMRGHGRSRDSVDLEPTLDRLGDDALAVADAAGVDAFHFVGESGGGTVGLQLASRHPNRVRTVTVCNSPYKGGALPPMEPIRALMAQGMDRWSATSMPIRFYPDEVSPEQWKWFEKLQASCSPEFFLANIVMLSRVDLTDTLPTIAAPVLILGSDGSSAVPPALLEGLYAKLPDARLQIFPHSKHGVAVSKGGDCGRALRSFLDGKTRS